MATSEQYHELADEADRVAAQFTDLLGHAAAANIPLPQELHDAHPALIGLPRLLRGQAGLLGTDLAPPAAAADWFEPERQ